VLAREALLRLSTRVTQARSDDAELRQSRFDQTRNA
jgi:hypothetical protein